MEPLRWVLLTTELVTSAEEARQVVRYYELRSTAPSIRWACLAVAKLGGFTDTKRTGRPGWDTMWHGWFRLQERLEGYQMSKLARATL